VRPILALALALAPAPAVPAPPPGELEGLPPCPGAVRDTAYEKLLEASGQIPYCPGLAAGRLGEELGGQGLLARRFQVLSSPEALGAVLARYRARLGNAPGNCNASDLPDPAALAPGAAGPVKVARCVFGAGGVSHFFRWRTRRTDGDLMDLAIEVREPRGGERTVRILLTEARHSSRVSLPVPGARELGVVLHPAFVFDVNASSRTAEELSWVFRARLPLEELVAFYVEHLGRKPSNADHRRVFLLGDAPLDYRRLLILHEPGPDGQVMAVITAPSEADT